MALHLAWETLCHLSRLTNCCVCSFPVSLNIWESSYPYCLDEWLSTRAAARGGAVRKGADESPGRVRERSYPHTLLQTIRQCPCRFLVSFTTRSEASPLLHNLRNKTKNGCLYTIYWNIFPPFLYLCNVVLEMGGFCEFSYAVCCHRMWWDKWPIFDRAFLLCFLQRDKVVEVDVLPSERKCG